MTTPTSFLEGLNQSGGLPALTTAVQNHQAEQKTRNDAIAKAHGLVMTQRTAAYRSNATSKREQAGKLAATNPALSQALYAEADSLDAHANEGDALLPMAVADPAGFTLQAQEYYKKPVSTSGVSVTKPTTAENGQTYSQTSQVSEADVTAQIGQADEVKQGKTDARVVARAIVGNPNKYDPGTIQKAQAFLTGQSTDTSFIGQKESLYTPEFVRDNLSKDPRTAFAAAKYLGQQASGLTPEDYAKLEKRTGQLDTVDELNLGLLGQALDKGSLDLESGRFDLTKAQSDWETAKGKDKQAQSGVITGWAAVGNLEALEAHKDEIVAAGFDYAKLEARAKVNREALDEERSTALAQGKTNLKTSQSQLRIVEGTEQGIIKSTNAKSSLEERIAAAAELLVGLKSDADRVDTLANIASKGEIGIGTLDELLKQGKIQKTEYDAAVAKAKTVTRGEQITLATAENGLTLSGYDVKLKGATLESIIAATNSSNDLTVRVNESKKGLLALTEKAERTEYLAQIAARGEIGVETIKGLVSDGTITQAAGDAAITAAKKAIRETDARLASTENGATLTGLEVKLKTATIDGIIESTNAQNSYDTNLSNAKKLLINITNANEQAEALAQIAAKGEIGQSVLDGLLDTGEISQREHDDAMKAAGRAVTRAKADEAQSESDLANANVSTAAARETLKNLPTATVANFSSMIDELAVNGDVGALNNKTIIQRAQELGVNLDPARKKAKEVRDEQSAGRLEATSGAKLKNEQNQNTLKNLPAANVVDFTAMVDELAGAGDLATLNNPEVVKRAQELGVSLEPARRTAKGVKVAQGDEKRQADTQLGKRFVNDWVGRGWSKADVFKTTQGRDDWNRAKKAFGMTDTQLESYLNDGKKAVQAEAARQAAKDALDAAFLQSKTDGNKSQVALAWAKYSTANTQFYAKLDQDGQIAMNKLKVSQAKPDDLAYQRLAIQAATDAAEGYRKTAGQLRDQAKALRNPSSGIADQKDREYANQLDQDAAKLEGQAKELYGQLRTFSGAASSPGAKPRAGAKPKEAQAASAMSGVADALGVNANDLMAIVSFETARTFSPTIRNPTSSATGIFQIVDRTAREMGFASSADFLKKNPTVEQQAQVFGKYLKDRGVKPGMGAEDIYVAVTGGARPGDPPSTVLYSKGSDEYARNPGWDVDKDGKITKGEIGQALEKNGHVRNYYDDGPAPTSTGTTAPGSSPAPTTKPGTTAPATTGGPQVTTNIPKFVDGSSLGGYTLKPGQGPMVTQAVLGLGPKPSGEVVAKRAGELSKKLGVTYEQAVAILKDAYGKK